MKSLLRTLKDLYSGPYQAALVFSFTLVAALTIGLGSWVISRTITSYLAEAMDEKVEQDLQCAELFYRTKQTGLIHTASQLALSNTVLQQFRAAAAGDPQASALISDKLFTAIGDATLDGNITAAVVDSSGKVIGGEVLLGDGSSQTVSPNRSWDGLDPVREVLGTGQPISATAVIPQDVLADAGLTDLAQIALLATPRAAPEPFDLREGSAGLGILAVSPILDAGELLGAVVVFHLFNNDFTLVDSIKASTQIDTVTIFFGDLRVSTNVMTAAGQRAVGTRVSEEVSQVVLQEGREYIGDAFVVNEYYITRYSPLRDFQGSVVGMLYVGARQRAFQDFLNTFRQRVALVGAVTIAFTFLLATPVSRVITQPLKDLQALAATSRKVAAGELDARAPTAARGEVGQLASAMNVMLDTLQETQKQLLQSEKLASLGQLAAGIAHELNNPLATVLLFSDMLLKDQGLPDQVLQDLEIVVKETERCKKIVSSLLDFARQHRVDAEEIDLNQLIRRVADTESRHDRYQGLEISLELADDLPAVQADPGQIQAVVSNLMSNGADAMPRGGKLVIRTRGAGPGRVAFEVEDQGMGISPENLARLYTPFFTTKPPGRGTGLGLSIVYGIVKMHRGDIHVESRLNQGTVVTVELPVRLPRTAERDQLPEDESEDLIG